MKIVYNENYTFSSSLNYNYEEFEKSLFSDYKFLTKPQIANYPSNYTSTWDF